jgi:hypothetical protein
VRIDGPDLEGVLTITVGAANGASRSVLAYPGTPEFALVERLRAALTEQWPDRQAEDAPVVQLTKERARRKGLLSKH